MPAADRTVEAARANGGQVHVEPMDVTRNGRFDPRRARSARVVRDTHALGDTAEFRYTTLGASGCSSATAEGLQGGRGRARPPAPAVVSTR